jgi:hypothetical protein
LSQNKVSASILFTHGKLKYVSMYSSLNGKLKYCLYLCTLKYCLIKFLPTVYTLHTRGIRECVDPEGNGVTMGRGEERGPGPPSGEQDKQLICNSGGDKTPLGSQEDNWTGSMRHQELIMYRVCDIVEQETFTLLYIVIIVVTNVLL